MESIDISIKNVSDNWTRIKNKLAGIHFQTPAEKNQQVQICVNLISEHFPRQVTLGFRLGRTLTTPKKVVLNSMSSLFFMKTQQEQTFYISLYFVCYTTDILHFII